MFSLFAIVLALSGPCNADDLLTAKMVEKHRVFAQRAYDQAQAAIDYCEEHKTANCTEVAEDANIYADGIEAQVQELWMSISPECRSYIRDTRHKKNDRKKDER